MLSGIAGALTTARAFSSREDHRRILDAAKTLYPHAFGAP